ncbi:Crp/Fnr family transcriptional regulator [Arundinibacter roseus]|uniref:Crp/Fnr family transcriptional regulator n=1 Tax=Arundinibacter roseus TaxID=2070510 RepID=A0A4R4JY27_9BACT|nr:Crp/Fnr family transcriptional regulator [Arundinibacter roseus]TDB58539.1 Crp/Fnr family transcriptional regulator [Arundinibacter roseus]
MSVFLEFLNQLVPLDERTSILVQSAVSKRLIKKKTILQREGSVCRKFYFIEKGCARVYYHKDDKEITGWFGLEGMIVSCIDSLFTADKTIYNIELLEDSVLHTVQYDIIEQSFLDYPLLERLGRLLVTQNYLLLDQRMKMIIFHSAEERYQLLLRQEPRALQRIPLSYIASYLNVTQETLSRIRAKY